MAKTISCIYKIINKSNNKIYIGSAVNFANRVRVHKCRLNNNQHHSIKLQNAWNKYGSNSFLFEVICICPKEYLIKLEQWFINNLKPFYNISQNAGSLLGTKRTMEQRLRMSKPRSYEGRKNMSINHSRKKQVAKYDLNGNYIETYNTLREATTMNKAYHISHVCNNKRKTFGGYIWKYIN